MTNGEGRGSGKGGSYRGGGGKGSARGRGDGSGRGRGRGGSGRGNRAPPPKLTANRSPPPKRPSEMQRDLMSKYMSPEPDDTEDEELKERAAENQTPTAKATTTPTAPPTSSEKRLKQELAIVDDDEEEEDMLIDDIMSPVGVKSTPATVPPSSSKRPSELQRDLMSKYLSSPSLDDDEETNHGGGNGQSQSDGVANGGQPNDNEAKSTEAAADGSAFSPKKKPGAASRLFAMQGRKTVMMEKAVVVSGAGCDKVNGVYKQAGNVNGKPVYAMTFQNETLKLWWNTGQWRIGEESGSYYYTSLSEEAVGGVWTLPTDLVPPNRTEPDAVDPPPKVTVMSGFGHKSLQVVSEGDKSGGSSKSSSTGSEYAASAASVPKPMPRTSAKSPTTISTRSTSDSIEDEDSAEEPQSPTSTVQNSKGDGSAERSRDGNRDIGSQGDLDVGATVELSIHETKEKGVVVALKPERKACDVKLLLQHSAHSGADALVPHPVIIGDVPLARVKLLLPPPDETASPTSYNNAPSSPAAASAAVPRAKRPSELQRSLMAKYMTSEDAEEERNKSKKPPQKPSPPESPRTVPPPLPAPARESNSNAPRVISVGDHVRISAAAPLGLGGKEGRVVKVGAAANTVEVYCAPPDDTIYEDLPLFLVEAVIARATDVSNGQLVAGVASDAGALTRSVPFLPGEEVQVVGSPHDLVGKVQKGTVTADATGAMTWVFDVRDESSGKLVVDVSANRMTSLTSKGDTASRLVPGAGQQAAASSRLQTRRGTTGGLGFVAPMKAPPPPPPPPPPGASVARGKKPVPSKPRLADAEPWLFDIEFGDGPMGITIGDHEDKKEGVEVKQVKEGSFAFTAGVEFGDMIHALNDLLIEPSIDNHSVVKDYISEIPRPVKITFARWISPSSPPPPPNSSGGTNDKRLVRIPPGYSATFADKKIGLQIIRAEFRVKMAADAAPVEALVVTWVDRGSPAEQQGVKEGHAVVGINDQHWRLSNDDMSKSVFRNDKVAKAMTQTLPVVPSDDEFLKIIGRAGRPLTVHFVPDTPLEASFDGGECSGVGAHASAKGSQREPHVSARELEEDEEKKKGPLGGVLVHMQLSTKVLGLTLENKRADSSDDSDQEEDLDDVDEEDDDEDWTHDGMPAQGEAALRKQKKKQRARGSVSVLPKAAGVVVSSVGIDSEAQLKGVLPGDRVYKVNNTTLNSLALPHKNVTMLMQQSQRPLRLVIERFPRTSLLSPGKAAGGGRLQTRLQTQQRDRGQQQEIKVAVSALPPAKRLQRMLEEAEIGQLGVPSSTIALKLTTLIGAQSTVPFFSCVHYWQLVTTARVNVVEVAAKDDASLSSYAAYEAANGSDLGLASVVARPHTGHLVVEEVRPASPAALAGIRPLDEILAVNGVLWALPPSGAAEKDDAGDDDSDPAAPRFAAAGGGAMKASSFSGRPSTKSSTRFSKKAKERRASVVATRAAPRRSSTMRRASAFFLGGGGGAGGSASSSRKRQSLGSAGRTTKHVLEKGGGKRGETDDDDGDGLVAKRAAEVFCEVLKHSARPIFLTLRRGNGDGEKEEGEESEDEAEHGESEGLEAVGRNAKKKTKTKIKKKQGEKSARKAMRLSMVSSN